MKIACRDVSGWDCEYEAEGDTAEEVKAVLQEHGVEVHSEDMALLSDEDKLEMKTKIDELLEAQTAE